MRSWFLALIMLVVALPCFAQINVDFNIGSQFSWVEQGTEVSITVRSAYWRPYLDSVEVILDPDPDPVFADLAPSLGYLDPDQYPVIQINCASGPSDFGYEMNVMINEDLGLAGHAPDSALVIATVDFVVPYSLQPETEFILGIVFFGWSNSPPVNCYPSVCFDVGCTVVTPSYQAMLR